MNNAWTGGQYSLFRVLFGAYLIVHFGHLLPWAGEVFSDQGMLADASASPLLAIFPNILAWVDSPFAVQSLLASALVAGVCFTLGWRDKIAAVWMWYVLACLFTRNPMIANPALPYVGWMLLAHCLIPGRPWGSLAAVGQSDPGAHWRMPGSVFIAAWLVLALTYSYSGYTKLLSPTWASGDMLRIVLENPLARDHALRQLFLSLPDVVLKAVTFFILYLELLFAPLALVKRLRPWLWAGMLFVQFGFLFLLNFPDLTAGMLLIHLLTFNPAWLTPARVPRVETLFYDGRCGLCHRVVRFVLAEDHQAQFSFAPLFGAAFYAQTSQAQRAALPDTFVVQREDKQLLIKSDAVVHLMRRLGGLWWLLSVPLAALPRSLRDKAYDFIGQRRQGVFKQPEAVCPLVPASLRTRFLLDTTGNR